MKSTVSRIQMITLAAAGFVLVGAFCWLSSCSGGRLMGGGFRNPVFTATDNTSFYFHDGKYYYPFNDADNRIYLCVSADPTAFDYSTRQVVCDAEKSFGLLHAWHPQIINIEGVWYIYFSGDDGNTDNHQIYVLQNSLANPLDGTFEMKGRIATDPADSWAIHANVFEHGDSLYMLWSGWESPRINEETQSIYIAAMENPWTVRFPRVKLSSPDYEWERQWVNSDGSKTAYPVYVNETPFFFAPEKSDSVYIYYSASAVWTVYYCVGQLSASRDANLLDPGSWHKSAVPVFAQNPQAGVYGPGHPFVIPSPDGRESFLVYMAFDATDNTLTKTNMRTVRMQPIEFTPSGEPVLGVPQPITKTLSKPSAVKSN